MPTTDRYIDVHTTIEYSITCLSRACAYTAGRYCTVRMERHGLSFIFIGGTVHALSKQYFVRSLQLCLVDIARHNIIEMKKKARSRDRTDKPPGILPRPPSSLLLLSSSVAKSSPQLFSLPVPHELPIVPNGLFCFYFCLCMYSIYRVRSRTIFHIIIVPPFFFSFLSPRICFVV